MRAILIVIGAGIASQSGIGPTLGADDPAASRVTIVTHAGRELTGVVDSRSDEHRLWLRQSGDNFVLASSVAWNDLASATLNGEKSDAQALRSRRDNLATVQPQIIHEAAAATSLEASESTAARQTRRMRNVEILDACLANLDRDVEPDGLKVTIAAVGDNGWWMPISGSFTAELLVERRPAQVSEVHFGRLDRWSRPVHADEFVDGAATYVLPFRRATPQWQFDVLPDAILTLRLGAFGHGNFAASAPMVLRKLDPLRDNRQLLDETRFMPGELRGRNPHNRLSPDNGLWLHWTR